ncbi:type II secretion system protein [Oceanimonas sp. CAM02]|uniref:pilus assembly FimT family protein n=1 Tax=Oceanimonas sp. CAM02 TaxID=3080336 RepID=UPI0029367A8B|nr:type II secretion system protein [Oceanimonas sp. CAM02]MDV2858628.1 type II secretion system protein [Oceanimonas sp. CAM02]
MKRAAGFTLIELVIVIVILGILGAVAAPRFFNLQGDAYAANMNALKSSIQSAMTMANAKALIEGNLDADGTASTAVDEDGKGSINGYDFIKFIKGYPAASKVIEGNAAAPAGILATLDDFDTTRYTLDVTGGGILTISPKSVADASNCKITYTEAQAGVPAKVEVETSGC